MIPIPPSLKAEANKGQISSADLPDIVLQALDAMGMWLGSGVLLQVESNKGQSANNLRRVLNSPAELRDILSDHSLLRGAAKLHFNRVTSGTSGLGLIGAMSLGELEVTPDGHEFFTLSLGCCRSTHDSCHTFLDNVERVLGKFDKRSVRFLGNYSA
jgi:hypothetical protein